jgi:hypothetical protein
VHVSLPDNIKNEIPQIVMQIKNVKMKIIFFGHLKRATINCSKAIGFLLSIWSSKVSEKILFLAKKG